MGEVTPRVSARQNALAKGSRWDISLRKWNSMRMDGPENVGIGTSYGLGPTKILYCDHPYRFHLDQFLSHSYRSLLLYLRLTHLLYISLFLARSISLTLKRLDSFHPLFFLT